MKKKAVTLVELIIVLAIMGIILGIAFSFFTSGNKTYKVTSEMIDTQERGRDILRIMSESIKGAELIKTLPTDKTGYTFVVTIKPYESDGTDKTYSYYIGDSDKNLYKFYNGTFTLTASDVKSINITTGISDLYNIDVIVYSDSSHLDTKTRSFSTTAKYIKRKGSI